MESQKRIMRYADEDDINLSREIRSTMALATDLGYRKDDIKKFVHAKNLTQLQNMLIDARRRA